jgi:hypothetical protein
MGPKFHYPLRGFKPELLGVLRPDCAGYGGHVIGDFGAGSGIGAGHKGGFD